MKKQLFLFVITVGLLLPALAQNKTYSEKYGNTFNIGVGTGLGTYGYYAYSIPAIHLDYEFDVAGSFTLAPFINFYTYKDNYYRETIIPIGVKGSLYLDNALKAGSNWDFYLGASLGFSIKNTVWENGFTSSSNNYRGPGSLYLVYHVGTEYHINQKVGAFLDLSNGISTIGLSFHR